MTINRREFIGAGMRAAALAGAVRSRPGRNPAAPIKIGAFGPMSGNAAAQGQSIREASRWWSTSRTPPAASSAARSSW